MDFLAVEELSMLVRSFNQSCLPRVPAQTVKCNSSSIAYLETDLGARPHPQDCCSSMKHIGKYQGAIIWYLEGWNCSHEC